MPPSAALPASAVRPKSPSRARPVAVEEDVGALEVAVHEAARVQRLERRGDVVDRARPALERAAAQLAEVAALEVFHDEERRGRPRARGRGRATVQLAAAARRRARSRLRAARGARRRRSRASSKNLSATSLAALAVSGEPDLGAAAAADPSHQHKPGAEFEPGCQLLHGDQPAPLDCAAGVFESAAGAGGAVGTRPVSSL